MTSYNHVDQSCAACGHGQRLQILASTNRFGSADLDLRPPSMERETLHMQVQCCSACGYCAPNLGKTAPERTAATMQRATYSVTLSRNDWPHTARRMACWALLEDSAGHPGLAGWASLRAAWDCDDCNKPELARLFRERAADQFERAIALGDPPCTERGLSQAVLSDVWRRAGHFQVAEAVACTGLALRPLGGLPRLVEDMLHFQIQLSKKLDASCRLIVDAERAAPDWPEREAAMNAERQCRAAEHVRNLEAKELRESPLRLVESLAALGSDFGGIDDHVPQDAQERAKRIQHWLKQLPLPPSMAAIMEANLRSYAWPVTPALAAFGAAVLERLGAHDRARHAGAEQLWTSMCQGHAEVLAYLHWCLRDATALVWHYSPPQRNGEGVKPPRYAGNQIIG